MIPTSFVCVNETSSPAPNDKIAPSCCNSKSCVSVTSPSAPIAIASVSEAEPILPASAITSPAPEVIKPVDVIAPDPTVPASVTFAPLNVAAVVDPDSMIRLPDVF